MQRLALGRAPAAATAGNVAASAPELDAGSD